jgi:hypothetical protein
MGHTSLSFGLTVTITCFIALTALSHVTTSIAFPVLEESDTAFDDTVIVKTVACSFICLECPSALPKIMPSSTCGLLSEKHEYKFQNIMRRTARWFTGYPLTSNKDVIPCDPFRIQRYCDMGARLYNAAGDSAVNRNKIWRFLTKCRDSRSILQYSPFSAQIVSASLSPHKLQ